jgi:flagellar biosynthetic protein FliP
MARAPEAATLSAMTTTHITRSNSRKLVRFVGHYLEMVVAMIVGMVALAPLWPAEWVARTDIHVMTMAIDMTIAMALWMRIRRHSWPRTAEMSATMFLPFLVLLVPYWLGALSAMGVMIAGHVIMFPLMLAVMLWRRADYWH